MERDPCQSFSPLTDFIRHYSGWFSQISNSTEFGVATFLLGLSISPKWDGVPVYEAFGMPVQVSGGEWMGVK
jgi:hypothetical protein